MLNSNTILSQGVFKSRTFVEMSEECLSYVLQSDKLKADESEVLCAVKEWSTVNAVSWKKIIPILKEIGQGK